MEGRAIRKESVLDRLRLFFAESKIKYITIATLVVLVLVLPAFSNLYTMRV